MEISDKELIILSRYEKLAYDEDDYALFFKGSIHVDNQTIKFENWGQDLMQKIIKENNNAFEIIISELKKISGLFSLIIKLKSKYFIAADLIRSLPIFYGYAGERLLISDNVAALQRQVGSLSFNNNKIEEFLASGFVYSNGTIFDNIKAIQAGELIVIDERDTISSRYFEFNLGIKAITSPDLLDFSYQLGEVLFGAFSRMIEQTPTVNRWIIPLSGGHDSRLIVNYLHRLGLKNVICYSYGMLGNEQSEISKQVANAFGYDWHFIEYTEQKWEKLHKEKVIDEYILFAFNGVSTPHLQDFLAVYEMNERGLLQKGDVFVPGHTYDWLAGSNFSDLDLQCRDQSSSLSRIISMHTTIKNLNSEPAQSIKKIFQKSNIKPEYSQEYFNWQEKRTKFMANSVRCYEFFGYEFRLPFWDRELVHFWLNMPDSHRMGRKMHLESEKDILLSNIQSIPFFGKIDTAKPDTKMEIFIKGLLPGFIKTIILRLTARKVKFNAGLNQIYALRANSVKDIISPVEDFPDQTKPYFKDFLNRYPYQIDYHFLTSLFTLRCQFNRYTKEK